MNAAAWVRVPVGALAFLVLAGHVLGDFYWQSDDMVAAKRRHPAWAAQFRHAVRVAAATGAALAFFVPWPVTAFAVALTGLTHLGIDVAKEGDVSRGCRPFAAFAWDQAAHLAIIAAFVLAVGEIVPGFSCPGSERDLLPGGLVPLPAAWLDGGRIALAALLCGKPGAVLVARLLESLPGAAPPGRPAAADDGGTGPGAAGAASPAAGAPGAGRWIGIVERLLVLALALAGAWAGVGMVIAAKSIVRFRRFEDPDHGEAFAEQFLVGTLASLLVALAAAWLAA